MWTANKQLYKAVQAASWEDVVLEDAFKEGLRRDTKGFFESKDIYEDLETIWKRGILLLGPPGNGKTESIKALLKETDYPALYVKSFTTPYGPEYGVRTIFDHARRHAPCILVLEDLDAMVVPKVRSFFLNELDGLAANAGILTIATTNHPERIDDAIVNRPSRFDVKYNFSLPDVELRKAFARKWVGKFGGSGTKEGNGGAEPVTRAKGVKFEMGQDEIAAKIAGMTEGFSFAFLKELFVSFLLSLAHSRSNEINSTSVDNILFQQIEKLSKQIIKPQDEGEKKENKEGEAADEPDSSWCPPEPKAKDSSQVGPSF
ncbi:P-loop containing nucleoside triphosphate hydrolase protein [Stereum hirsutum FP-91666 SS1]|uniref:P-loop containing nucleoside triphosphate hydrolase protein n=1 Tax=Stereum hirsutum (strain FP-91666) TaxID=721885 RepID=UPI000444A458|nr:P-loop containing nucleoside triphosphate hydrolase protein [Stereum hirsutum FP-91666 SS1]EIM84771.1 P-loop containing nucleoside triphosphate hydrolase protein [Stereum hirsutum FP-91666 SS1]